MQEDVLKILYKSFKNIGMLEKLNSQMIELEDILIGANQLVVTLKLIVMLL